MSNANAKLMTTVRAEPGVPIIPLVNWTGLRTLYVKEIRRFFKVQLQTIWAPAVNTLLFLAIFTVALQRGSQQVLGVHFADFLAPGLLAVSMIQNAFANSSSSILVGKIQGTIVDALMPPISPGELLFSYVAGAVTRAWLVALATAFALLFWPGVDLTVREPWAILFFGTFGAILLALMGVVTGLWAEKFDHAAAVTNFIVQPATLLSGTFYTVDRLTPAWRAVSAANPFFYVIDGFRFGFLGIAESRVAVAAAVLVAVDLLLAGVCYRLLRVGWRIKA